MLQTAESSPATVETFEHVATPSPADARRRASDVRADEGHPIHSLIRLHPGEHA